MQERGSHTKGYTPEGVKLSGSLDAGKNCKWIVSLETPVRSGAEGANNTNYQLPTNGYLIRVLNLSGKRTEDALSSLLIHLNYMNSIF